MPPLPNFQPAELENPPLPAESEIKSELVIESDAIITADDLGTAENGFDDVGTDLDLDER
jgi:hypothetical protein